MARFLAERGAVVIASLISPFEEDRARAREATRTPFRLVYICASLELCRQRDPKGYYADVNAGRVAQFTGVSSPYEVPVAPDLILETGQLSVAACVDELMRLVTDTAPLMQQTPSAP